MKAPVILRTSSAISALRASSRAEIARKSRAIARRVFCVPTLFVGNEKSRRRNGGRHQAGDPSRPRPRLANQAGFTFIELIITMFILMILASVAMPLARVSFQRRREIELRRDLREMRDAIDRYKDLADRNQIMVKAGTDGYPPTLETLVDGVDLSGKPGERIRFLREIPVDPMTGQKNWGMRCAQDPPDSGAWCGDDVFDVYSQSTGTALDGTKYADW